MQSSSSWLSLLDEFNPNNRWKVLRWWSSLANNRFNVWRTYIQKKPKNLQAKQNQQPTKSQSLFLSRSARDVWLLISFFLSVFFLLLLFFSLEIYLFFLLSFGKQTLVKSTTGKVDEEKKSAEKKNDHERPNKPRNITEIIHLCNSYVRINCLSVSVFACECALSLNDFNHNCHFLFKLSFTSENKNEFKSKNSPTRAKQQQKNGI